MDETKSLPLELLYFLLKFNSRPSQASLNALAVIYLKDKLTKSDDCSWIFNENTPMDGTTYCKLLHGVVS